MAYSINTGNMAGDITGTVVEVRGMRTILVRAQWDATGSPQGVIGLKVGVDPNRLTDIGNPALLAGVIPVVGSQPNLVAGVLMFEMSNGAAHAQAFYTRTGGGAANTSLIVEISGN